VSLTPGTRIGSYSIAAQIGVGGMGEVYRATDTKLGRDVAIKVLPDAFAQDAERLARFDREARTLASLNHPGIAHIYGVEDMAGSKALVMELVEGPTLADRIAEGPIPLDEALRIAGQVAQALEAAHEQGIIHRDLKPANVKVRSDGTVKVLDFGLAKAMESSAGTSSGLSMSPTITTPAMTQAGLILGTAAYMSPEQARGRPATRRADVWSFGAVLFEMLAGTRPFPGDDVSQTLARVIERDPDWGLLPPNTPPRIRRVLEMCLQKDPARRVGDMGAVRLALEGAFETTTAPSGGTAAPSWRVDWRWAALIGSAALVLGVVIGGAALRQAARGDTEVQRFAIVEPTAGSLENGTLSQILAISPDGLRIAYLSGGGNSPQLHVRRLDELEPTTLGTGEVSYDLAFSPDGRSIAFFDLKSRSLKRVSVNGGDVETISPVGENVRGVSWGDGGTLVFSTLATESGLWRVPAGGGEPEALTQPDPAKGEQNHVAPDVMPGGETVLFTVLGTAGRSWIEALSLETGERHVVVDAGRGARYVPPGYLLYTLGNVVRAVRFDPDRLQTIGESSSVLQGTVIGGSFGLGTFSVSNTGSLVYAPVDAGPGRQLVWVDRAGQVTGVLAEGGGLYARMALSPNGNQVVVSRSSQQGGVDLWVRDIETGREVPLTDGNTCIYPVWKPDGSAVTYSSNANGAFNVFSRPVDLSGQASEVLASPIDSVPGSWTPDGRTLVYYEVAANTTARDVKVLSADGDSSVFLGSAYNERSPRLSPDGNWLAYVSNQSGEDRVFVQKFPEGGRVVPISVGPAAEPMWSRDGTELFYRNASEMWVVSITTTPTLVAGRPRLLFDEPYETDPDGQGNPAYDVSLDGTHLLMATTPTGRNVRLVFVRNWIAEIERLLSSQ